MSVQPPKPLAADLKSLWQLSSKVTFLNHGSYGALPRKIAALADDWRRRIEADPIEMLGRQWPDLIAAAKVPVATFLNADPATLGFVTNATEGVNAVLRSMVKDPEDPRDELVTTSHVYHAVRQAMKFVGQQMGFGYREIDIPLPVGSAGDIADRVIAGLNGKTRMLVIDHVTSPTALVFPIEPIAEACQKEGIELLVDGAHAPGMLPLDLSRLGELGVSYYAGNLHKWCCAVKGTAFIWARADKADGVHPTVISHWYGDGFSPEFHWQGTRDHTGWLTAGDAIDFLGQFGWENVRQHNHQLATWANQMLCRKLNASPISPIDGSLLGSMATVALPQSLLGTDEPTIRRLQQELYTKHHIEFPLIRFGHHRLFRVSCQVYNTPEEYQIAADAVEGLGTPSPILASTEYPSGAELGAQRSQVKH